MSYIKRISDNELEKKLNSSGAVLIRDAKAYGKTESAKQFAGSILNVDQDEQIPVLMETAPSRLLFGILRTVWWVRQARKLLGNKVEFKDNLLILQHKYCKNEKDNLHIAFYLRFATERTIV